MRSIFPRFVKALELKLRQRLGASHRQADVVTRRTTKAFRSKRRSYIFYGVLRSGIVAVLIFLVDLHPSCVCVFVFSLDILMCPLLSFYLAFLLFLVTAFLVFNKGNYWELRVRGINTYSVSWKQIRVTVKMKVEIRKGKRLRDKKDMVLAGPPTSTVVTVEVGGLIRLVTSWRTIFWIMDFHGLPKHIF